MKWCICYLMLLWAVILKYTTWSENEYYVILFRDFTFVVHCTTDLLVRDYWLSSPRTILHCEIGHSFNATRISGRSLSSLGCFGLFVRKSYKMSLASVPHLALRLILWRVSRTAKRFSQIRQLESSDAFFTFQFFLKLCNRKGYYIILCFILFYFILYKVSTCIYAPPPA
jgi:hypothetical protein